MLSLGSTVFHSEFYRYALQARAEEGMLPNVEEDPDFKKWMQSYHTSHGLGSKHPNLIKQFETIASIEELTRRSFMPMRCVQSRAGAWCLPYSVKQRTTLFCWHLFAHMNLCAIPGWITCMRLVAKSL